MKCILTSLLLLLSLPALAVEDTAAPYRIKRLSVAVRARGVGTIDLNRELIDAGYIGFPISFGCASLGQSTYFSSNWGFWYNGSYGRASKKDEQRSLSSESFEIAAGTGYEFYTKPYMRMRAVAGLWFGGFSLRTYNDATDTTSLSNYIRNQPADTKRFAAQQGGVTLGLEVQPRLSGMISLMAAGGYNVPFTTAALSHDGGSFRRAPLVNVSTWYLQAGFLFEWQRYERWEDQRATELITM